MAIKNPELDRQRFPFINNKMFKEGFDDSVPFIEIDQRFLDGPPSVISKAANGVKLIGPRMTIKSLTNLILTFPPVWGFTFKRFQLRENLETKSCRLYILGEHSFGELSFEICPVSFWFEFTVERQNLQLLIEEKIPVVISKAIGIRVENLTPTTPQ